MRKAVSKVAGGLGPGRLVRCSLGGGGSTSLRQFPAMLECRASLSAVLSAVLSSEGHAKEEALAKVEGPAEEDAFPPCPVKPVKASQTLRQ